MHLSELSHLALPAHPALRALRVSGCILMIIAATGAALAQPDAGPATDNTEGNGAMNSFETPAAENIAVAEELYKAMNSLDVDAVMTFFDDDVAVITIDDSLPPTEGKDALAAFFRKFFSSAGNVHFEVVGKLQAAGNMVMVRQIDHYQWEGAQRHDYAVTMLYITNGKIKKWLGQPLKL